MLANSLCVFLNFNALVFVVFYLLHLEAVFPPARFSLTAYVSHGALGLVLCLFGMHSAAASLWILTKLSYLSFGVCVSFFSCSVSNSFLSFLMIGILKVLNDKYFWELKSSSSSSSSSCYAANTDFPDSLPPPVGGPGYIQHRQSCFR